MNSLHDMGGTHGYGPINPEHDEPVFHHAWEKRAFAITLAMGPCGKWNIDKSRAARESLPPLVYLSSSYYEIWLEGLLKLMTSADLITTEEARDGLLRAPPKANAQALKADQVAPALRKGGPTLRNTGAAATFRVGDTVRTLAMNPPTHTRLPRYCRDKPGTIVAIHGEHVFPDTNALDQGENPKWLYTVRFEARDLWGPDTTATAVHVDCWEPYLTQST